MALIVKVEKSGADVTISFDGILNEDSTLPDMEKCIHGRLILHLEKLTMINSIGCRTWLDWIKRIQAPEGVVLQNCSPAFIAQVSVLKGFVPQDSKLESFFLPYHCDSCDHDTNILIRVGHDNSVADDLPCPKCGSKMECDVVSQTYQRFLKPKV